MSTPRESASSDAGDLSFFERMAGTVTRMTGSPWAFLIALLIVVVWGVTGPIFHFSDTWQLVINTGTTIVTFLMVFVIQQSQNKDTVAIHLKLNELIASSRFSSNRLIDIESLSERELDHLRAFYVKMAARAKDARDIHESHSLDEAGSRHKPRLPDDQQ